VERAVWHPVDDATIFSAIQKGVGIMPASGLSEERAWEIVAFVRSLTSPAIEVKAPGDGAAGEKLFWGTAGCAGCHRIAGKGGFVGPDLTNVGRTSTLPKLRSSILEPDEVRTPGYQMVSLVLRDGTKLEGIEKDRTNYDLQLQLKDGTLRSLPVGKIESMTARARTAMPGDYKTRFTREQVNDLVAYLRLQAVQ
jgi:putative heme-binding domain-containing protein